MFPCFICEAPFDTVDGLSHHLCYQHNLSGNYVCFFCKQHSKLLHNYKAHLTKKHANHDEEWNRHLARMQAAIPVENNVINIDNANNEADVPNPADHFIVQDEDGDVDEGDDRFSLQNFIDSLYKDVQLYIAKLYSVPNLSRKFVDTIISGTSELIAHSVNALKDNVFRLLASFDDLPQNFAAESVKIENMFATLGNPFEFMKTEHRRLSSLIERGCYIPPTPFEMGEVENYEKTHTGHVELVRSPVYGQVIPLGKVLKAFLEQPGIFVDIRQYLDELRNSNVVSNFVQGELWAEISRPYEDDGKFVLPLHIEFDDYEPDNALGSHHNQHSLGALYALIPCIRPEFRSCLDNMFVLSIFESKSRKMFGNAVAFAPSIEELKKLKQEGIVIVVNGERLRVYFLMCLIIGDNAGLNAIEGFIEGFRGNFFCRICKLHRNEMSHRCTPPPANRLRTIQNYDADLLVRDSSQTGIKELCEWNAVGSFHCVTNASCDLLHDLYEGGLTYGICNVLYYLIEVRGYFDIDTLKTRIDGFNYGPTENGNKPPTAHLTLPRLESCSWNLSGCEMLCLSRNLCLMIGDLVPVGNSVWKLYLVLRELVEVLTCPVLAEGVDVLVNNLVQHHHEIYTYYFGNLKPVHHFMVHYGRLLKRNGPLVNLSALMLERNHRRGKLYARVCNSRVNFPLTVAIKFQLYLCERLMRPENFKRYALCTGVSRLQVCNLENYRLYAHVLPYNADVIVTSAKGVEICGTKYTITSLVVIRVDDLFPVFGKIVKIIVDGNNTLFVLNVLRTKWYIDHNRAYIVEDSDEFTCISQRDLIYKAPLWQRTYKHYNVVTLKHSL